MGIGVLAVIENDLQLIRDLSISLNAPDFSRLSITRSFPETSRYLKGEGIYSNRHFYPIPTVLLLDVLNPTGIDLEVLEWLRNSTRYRELPVGILTNSSRLAFPLLHLDSRTFIVDRSGREPLLDQVLSIARVESGARRTRGDVFAAQRRLGSKTVIANASRPRPAAKRVRITNLSPGSR